MKVKLKLNMHIVLLVLLIIMLSMYMVYWGTQKEGFHVDEMFSLMDMSGNTPLRVYFSDGFYDTWHDAADLKQAVSVSAENAFSFGGRITPYFLLLHIAYSFVPGVFSIWPGIILNIIFYIGTLIVLYLLSRFVIKDRFLALLPVLLWGVSSVAIDTVIYIRFYAMILFLCTALVYAAFVTLQNVNELRKPAFWVGLFAVMLTLFLGVWAHQYFWLYAFFLIAFVCLYLLLNKKVKLLLIVVGGTLLAVAVFQLNVATFAGILGDGRGAEAVYNFLDFDIDRFIWAALGFLGGLKDSLFGGVRVAAILAVSLLSVVVLILFSKKDSIKPRIFMKSENAFLLIMGSVCASYFVVLSHIAPISEITPLVPFRYITYITPILMLVFVALLVRALEKIRLNINKAKLSQAITFSLIAVPFSLLLVFNTSLENLFPVDKERAEVLAEYHELPVVHIAQVNRQWDVANCYWHFFEFDNQVLFALGEWPNIAALSEKEFEDGLLLFVSTFGGLDVRQAIDGYLSATGLTESEFVIAFDDFYLDRHRVYLLG